MSEAHADPEIPGGHEVQPGTGLSTSVLKQLMQLVLGDARDAVEVAKAAHGRGHLPVVGIQSAKAEARDAEILTGAPDHVGLVGIRQTRKERVKMMEKYLKDDGMQSMKGR